MKAFLLAVVVVLAGLVHSAEDDGGQARLLASKNILNQLAVEGKDLTVEYKIYNVGSSSAINVMLSENGFPETDFEVVHGNLQVRWERIAPESNVSHAVILRPLKSGFFNFSSAEVKYLADEDATEPLVGYTSAPGEGGIMPNRDYDRKFSPHLLDWATFALMTVPSLGFPFIFWYRSSCKYNTVSTKKSKRN